MFFIIAMVAGTNFVGPAGAWAAGGFFGATGTINGVTLTSDIMIVTGVVVLPGIEVPSAARAPLIMRPFDQELLTCQRYLETVGLGMVGVTSSSSSAIISTPYKVIKRAAPTLLTPAGTITIYANANFNTTAAPTIGANDVTGGTINIGGFAGMTGNIVAFLTAHPGLRFDARL
jgi:hypothetical protein